MEKEDMSPLRYYTLMQSKKLSEKIKDERTIVDFAMRYGNPSIKSKMNKLQREGCENIIILPLYPQYAACLLYTSDAADE